MTLPLHARKILDAHLRKDDDTLALTRSRTTRQRELRRDLVRAQQQLADAKEAGLDPAKAEAEVVRIKAAIADLSVEGAKHGFGLRLKDALESSPVKKWKPCIPDLGKLGKADVPKLDSEIDSLIFDREGIVAAPLAVAEQRAALKAAVASLGGAPTIVNGRVQWPTTPVPVREGAFLQQIPNGAALVAWLFGPELENRMAAMIKTDPAALTRAERRSKLAKIDASILELQRTRAALAEKFSLSHRADAPVETILQIIAA